MRKSIFRTYIQITFFLLIVGNQVLYAQQDPDLHFSQFTFNNLIINPSYAGKSNNISFSSFYRNQWIGFKDAPTTETFSVHSPIPGKNFGVGMHIINDNIGLEKHLTGMLSGAYHIHTRNSVFSMGLSGGFKQLGLRGGLILEDTVNIDPVYANFSTTTVFNSGFGLHYRTKNFFTAFSITNLNQAKLKYNTNTISRLSRHYYGKVGYNYQYSKTVAIRPTLLVSYQQASPIQAYCNLIVDYQSAYWAGLGYRTGDALAAIIGMHVDKIKSLRMKEKISIGYAYEWTANGLPNYNAGTHEIMLLYDFHLNVTSKVHNPKYKRLE